MSFDSHDGQTQYDPEAEQKARNLEHHHKNAAPAAGPVEIVNPVHIAHKEPVHIVDSSQPAQKPSIGRIVHYVMTSGRNKGEHRPGMIVRVWSDTCVQLQVFTDSANDFSSDQQGYDGLFWATSVAHDETEKKQGTWHWPERV